MTEQSESVLEFSDPCDEIAKAFVLAQTKFAPIKASEEGKIESDRAKYSYKYADLAGVLAGTVPSLNAAGIAFVQGVVTKGVAVTCETRLLHASGQWIRNRLSLDSTGTGAQKLGSAMTYARRYSALAVLGVAPADDDDGRSASTRDDRDATIAALTQAIEDAAHGVAAISKRILSRSVPVEWQVATAFVVSGERTKIWGELSVQEMLRFHKAMGDAFPAQTTPREPDSAPESALPEPGAPDVASEHESRAEGNSRPVASDPEEQTRQSLVAWIETKLRDVSVDDADLQTFTMTVRDKTLTASPESTLSITYDWRELSEPELREFWKLVPKKSREKAAAPA